LRWRLLPSPLSWRSPGTWRSRESIPHRLTIVEYDFANIEDHIMRTLLAAAAHGLPTLYFEPSPNVSGALYKADPSLIVIHDCEGSYQGSVGWFASLQSHVSAHFVVSEDGSEVTQCVRIKQKAWAQCAFNTFRGAPAISIEISGAEAKGFGEKEWGMVARMTACFCRRYKIPVVASKGYAPGITRHFDLGLRGGGHKDPTMDQTKWNWFLGLVAQEFAKGDFPDAWGRE
jgi:hypothetical protein